MFSIFLAENMGGIDTSGLVVWADFMEKFCELKIKRYWTLDAGMSTCYRTFRFRSLTMRCT